MPNIPTQNYTSEEEMASRMSRRAIRITASDVGGTHDDLVNAIYEAIAQASDDISLYLEPWYEPADMLRSRYIRTRCTVMACHHLCTRKGNPSPFLDEYTACIATLERINKGEFQVPGLPTRADFTPALSNYRVDDRYIVNKVRVEPTLSTGGIGARQDVDYFPYEGT